MNIHTNEGDIYDVDLQRNQLLPAHTRYNRRFSGNDLAYAVTKTLRGLPAIEKGFSPKREKYELTIEYSRLKSWSFRCPSGISASG